MKRRTFIHQLAHAAAMPTLFSSFGINPLNLSSYSLLSNTLQDGNILIVLLLNGGNDGLNMVIPLNMKSNLHSVRPNVVLPDNKILSLGTNDLGLHPSLSFFKSLHDEKRLKIVHSVGYKNPSYSHFRSMDILQTASDSHQYLNSGWLGRYLENKHPEFPEAYPSENYPHPLALEMGWNSSLQFTGTKSFTSIVSSTPDNFYEIINEFDNHYPSTNLGEKLTYLQLMAKQSNAYGEVLKETYNKGALSGVEFPRSNLADQFKIIAKLISGGLNTRIYKVEIGGFDTHGSQVDPSDHTKGEHANLLSQINNAVQAFMQEMDAQKKSDKILGMTLTEFGRTVHSNGTNGTDHGTVSPMLFFGNKLDTSVLGENPNIPSRIDGQYDLNRQFDYRQLYQAVINQWLGGTSTTSSEVLFKDFDDVQLIAKEYADLDGDGVGDPYDLCNNTTPGALVDIHGCELFNLPQDNYEVTVISATCLGSSNGSIQISATAQQHTYNVTISGQDSITLSTENDHHAIISGLAAGSYQVCFTVLGQENYQQCFGVQISEPAPLSASSKVNYSNKTVHLSMDGSTAYTLKLNGKSFVTTDDELYLDLKTGLNTIEIATDLSCQGSYFEEIFVSEEVLAYPNPTIDWVQLYVGGSDPNVKLQLSDLMGRVYVSQEFEVPVNRTLELQMNSYPSGMYFIQVQGAQVKSTLKVIKE